MKTKEGMIPQGSYYPSLGRSDLPAVLVAGNQVEIWFGIMSRKALRGASFKSTEDLAKAINDFITVYGPTAKPFVWRKREVKGSQLKNTIVNLRN